MNGSAIINRLRKKYTTLRLVETVLAAFGVGLTLWAMGTSLRIAPVITIAAAGATSLTMIIVRVRQLGLLSLTNERLSYFLNGAYPPLQDSSELLIRTQGQLTTLEEIQLLRTERAIQALSDIRLPHHTLRAAMIFVAGLAVAALSAFVKIEQPAAGIPSTSDNSKQATIAPSTPELTGYTLTVLPPTYTAQREFSTEHLSITVAEGSSVTWRLRFSTPPQEVSMHFSNGDSVLLSIRQEEYTGTRKIVESMIYQVRWETSSGVFSSDYFEITMKPDGVPLVQITGLQQFTRLGWGEKTFIDVPVELRDDFGLSKGHIIATVSKGSGESVKFREEQLAFNSPASVRGKAVSARRRIDFNQLGMEPGDEIYFYAEAWDNKTPEPQRTRTETFFVSLQDTASNTIVADASLGVDLMPEYFRSQRQIIIDTEKLLKDQPVISKQVFKSTSNELGYDQKVLRLKYGQFLGEEFETNIGAPAHQEEVAEDEDDPSKKFEHKHDKDNEHNLVPEKKTEAGHDHDEDEDENDPIAAFKHNHDNMEEATFFTQSVRSKLKAALTLMWDAELQLRLFEPKASLPIQYKILNLLKEISQDSRIYVHRMGFDPPPLKEEKRLTGDLEEISGSETTGTNVRDKSHPAIRKALVTLNAAIQSGLTVPDEKLNSDLQDAAAEIAAASIATPGSYLVHLSMIRSIIDGKLDESEYLPALLEIRAACWKILPYEDPGPGQLPGMRHQLDERLVRELKKTGE